MIVHFFKRPAFLTSGGHTNNTLEREQAKTTQTIPNEGLRPLI